MCLFSLPLLLLQDPTPSWSCFETLIFFPVEQHSGVSVFLVACTFFGMQQVWMSFSCLKTHSASQRTSRTATDLFHRGLAPSSPLLSWTKSARKIMNQLNLFNGTEGKGTCYLQRETWNLKEIGIHYLPSLKLIYRTHHFLGVVPSSSCSMWLSSRWCLNFFLWRKLEYRVPSF